MENTESKKQVKHKIDVFDDVVDIVLKYDTARLLNSPDTEKLHKQAVTAITKANSQYGDGFVSISKVRSFQQSMQVSKKEEAKLREDKRVQTRRQK